ncbi:MAG TPA: CDP-archaeol synthase [Candidatus Nanoarchaeia archaeon]|nr:CDP-archaeol synthase [Candidatus Nanoarchaeia archaeon]
MIIESLYFFLPGYIANMAPILLRWIPFGGKPIHEKLFGSHKTWRGLVVAILVGGLVFLLQKALYNIGFQSWALIDYADFPGYFGFLQGAGVILGDLVKSFYKRKQGIKSGNPWWGWDQVDFVIGGLLLGFLVYVPPAGTVLLLMIVSPILHLLANNIGYLLKIKKNKF